MSIAVTEKQLCEMRHALGLNYKSKPYRNYFFCDTNNESWNNLVSQGLATKSEPTETFGITNSYFYLTKKAVELVTGKSITDKKFNDL